MIVTDQVLKDLEEHWAVVAVRTRDRTRAGEAAIHRHVQANIGRQLAITFDDKPGDEERIQRLATAYEIAATEGIRALLFPTEANESMQLQAIAGAYRAFELRRTLSVPEQPAARVFHVLHLAALAYCSDRGTDIKRWLRETPTATAQLPIAVADWGQRLTYQLFDCWIRLWRKEEWKDLDGVRDVIGRLRDDQSKYEQEFLDAPSQVEAQSSALHLIALYHLAKASELLAVYLLQGETSGRIDADLDQHFEAAIDAATAARDSALDVLLRWLHVAARRMAGNSVWRVSEKVNAHVKTFVKQLTTSSKPMFELLPPQRVALRERGLLDPVDAVVVDLPTSAGKTLLAEFRIIQALDQFRDRQGWVAYVAPTRALTGQITRRLRTDLQPLGFQVEQLTAATEIDAFEDALLSSSAASPQFDVLVATPEKLNLVIRNQKVPRPLALLILDEAHNLEDEARGLRIELLLATVKTDCPSARFLLLMPNVPNGSDLARWLGAEDSRSISLSTSPWQPNERLVGLYWHEKDDTARGSWRLKFETLTTTHRALHLKGVHDVGTPRPLATLNYSDAKSLANQTAAMAKVFSERSSDSTAIAIAGQIPWVWSMARILKDNLPRLAPIPPSIQLVQRFLKTEISPKFELIEMLSHGVGVHHAGLSDESRNLIEYLAERGDLRVLCATTTIAQGINFPVSAVFMQDKVLYSNEFPYRREMSSREFWNLAGRAGRIRHESIGVVGLAAGSKPEEMARFVGKATGDLISRLVQLLDDVEKAGEIENLSNIIQKEPWTDFRSYVAHLVNEKQTLDEVLSSAEPLLRNTFGFMSLQTRSSASTNRKAKALLNATKEYAEKVAKDRGRASLVDQTGFSFESVGRALHEMGTLSRKLTPSDWEPSSLFGAHGKTMLPQLIGVLMRVPEIQNQMNDLSTSGLDHKHVAALAQAWVSGRSIEQIATEYFATSGSDVTDQVTAACRAVYKNLAIFGTWGLSALTKLGPSGLDFEKLPPDVKRRINLMPAMLYHGVHTEGGVLMRMNSVPRSIAESIGSAFSKEVPEAERTTQIAREFIRSVKSNEWQRMAPKDAALTGDDYREVWALLAGEASD